jgi:hypothetical protein
MYHDKHFDLFSINIQKLKRQFVPNEKKKSNFGQFLSSLKFKPNQNYQKKIIQIKFYFDILFFLSIISEKIKCKSKK